MKAPMLNRRLVLEARSDLPDGAGGQAQGWVPIGTLWAEVAPRSGREARTTGAPVSRATHRITLRAAPIGSQRRPQPQQRFVEGSRIYHITAVREADAFGTYLLCDATEEVFS